MQKHGYLTEAANGRLTVTELYGHNIHENGQHNYDAKSDFESEVDQKIVKFKPIFINTIQYSVTSVQK